MPEFTSVSRRDLMAAAAAAEDTKKEITLKISSDLNRKDIVELGDGVFFNTAMFVFHNNKYANSFFVNEVTDREYSDLAASYNIKYDSIESSLTLEDPALDGVYLSTELCTDKGYRSELNDFFLVVDETVPAGCDILYYIITDRDKVYPIKPNATTPLHIEEIAERPIYFRLKAIIHANGIDYPSVNAYAILYHDQFVEDSYGLINPNLSNEDNVEEMDDLITLIRDPANQDKLVQVVTATEDIKLTYDPVHDNRLFKIETFSNHGDNKKLEEDTLIYGDYLNSEGTVEEVLKQIAVKKKFPPATP
jgi:hypothetical protein